MNKQEQIKEMKKIIGNVKPFYVETIVEALYNAGYRKIDDLKSENKQLKTECALLDDELRIARQDTIDVLNELKTKSYVNDYCREVVEVEKIDELIKEQLKK